MSSLLLLRVRLRSCLNLFSASASSKTKTMKMDFTEQRKSPVLFITWVLIFSFCCVEISAKSRHPITENEIRLKKNQCYDDIESGLWGQRCMSSRIAKENCALRCLSPSCYEIVYQSDPLEEGEKDYVRSQEYKYCMHKDSLGESLDGIRGAYG